MRDNEPNKTVSALWKRFKKNNEDTDWTQAHYLKQEELCKECEKITLCVGAVSVMSKNSILKLIAMQSRLRFMAHHTFYIYMRKAVDDLNL